MKDKQVFNKRSEHEPATPKKYISQVKHRLRKYAISPKTQSKIDTQQTDLLDESDRSLYNQMLDDIQDKETTWDKVKRNIMPKYFKKAPHDRDKLTRQHQPKKAKHSQMKRRIAVKKDQSRTKAKFQRKKNKRGRMRPGTNEAKETDPSESDPYQLIYDERIRKRGVARGSKSRGLDKQGGPLRSQDFDQVFRMRKEIDRKQRYKKKKNSYLSGQPNGPSSSNQLPEKVEDLEAQFMRLKPELKESEILSSKLASKASSVSIGRPNRKNGRKPSGIKKKKVIELSINSESSLEKIEKKGRRLPRKTKVKRVPGRDTKKGPQKLRKIDAVQMMMASLRDRPSGIREPPRETRDNSKFSTKRTKVIKKKSNFQNFMEKLERIDRVEKGPRRMGKAQKQREERVKNEYFQSRKGSQSREQESGLRSNRFSVQNGQNPLTGFSTREFVTERPNKSMEEAIGDFPERFSVKPMAEAGQLLLTQNEERDKLQPIWEWVEKLNQREFSEVLNQLTQCETD